MFALRGMRRRNEAVRFAPDGRHVAAVGTAPGVVASGVEVWDLAAPDAAPAVWDADKHEGRALAFSPDGRWLFAVTQGHYPGFTRGLLVYDRVTGTAAPLAGGARHAADVAVTPDGTRLLAAGSSTARFGPSRREEPGPIVAAWDITAGPPFPVRWTAYPDRADTAVGSLDLFPDGDRFATVEQIGDYPVEGTAVRVRSAADGRVLHEADCPNQFAQQVAVSPDGRRIAVRSQMSLFVWDNPELAGRPVKRTNDTRKHFAGAAFHPSGRFLATAGNDAVVKVWDTATWAVAAAFTWRAGKMRSVAFSRDGLLAAAGTDKGQVVVWDVDL